MNKQQGRPLAKMMEKLCDNLDKELRKQDVLVTKSPLLEALKKRKKK